jgi:hypothetical protein
MNLLEIIESMWNAHKMRYKVIFLNKLFVSTGIDMQKIISNIFRE